MGRLQSVSNNSKWIVWAKKRILLIVRFIKKLHVAFRQYPMFAKEFGFFLANVQLKENLTNCNIGHSSYYIKKASKYMIKELQPIIMKYDSSENANNIRDLSVFKDKVPIWFCWWQGEDDMPPIVELCYRRVRRAFDNDSSEVVLLTEHNYMDYLELPEYVVEKYNKGIICRAHFADILRWGLVQKYGGFWLDATVYITYNSIERIKEQLTYPFFTQRFKDESECPNEPCRGLWCNFYFMSNPKASVDIFAFVFDSLLFYWKTHNSAFDYVFLDYIIWAGYESNLAIKHLIDSVPENNKNIWLLWNKMNDEYCQKEWIDIMNNNEFYKLTYKYNWQEETEEGKRTNYAKLLEELILLRAYISK